VRHILRSTQKSRKMSTSVKKFKKWFSWRKSNPIKSSTLSSFFRSRFVDTFTSQKCILTCRKLTIVIIIVNGGARRWNWFICRY
jgi:hypothetical protein